MAAPIALSVVIPARDEALRLPVTLQRVAGYLLARNIDYEIVVIDDGSTDATGVHALATRTPGLVVETWARNRGKGAAVRRGVELSRGARILITDADLSTPIEQLEALEPRLAEAPLVYGSRSVAASRVLRRQPALRMTMGKCFNRLLRVLGVEGLVDTQCGFKLLDGEVGRELVPEIEIEGFAWDVELTWRARQRGLRIVEVGVVWRHCDDSKVSLTGDAWRMLVDVLRLRRRLGPPRQVGRVDD